MFDVDKLVKKFFRELSLVPKVIVGALSLGFGPAMILDIFLGFTLSRLSFYLLSRYFQNKIFHEILGLDATCLTCLKWGFRFASPLTCCLLTALFAQQSFSALLLSTAVGYSVSFAAYLGTLLFSNIFMGSDYLLLRGLGHGLSWASPALRAI